MAQTEDTAKGTTDDPAIGSSPAHISDPKLAWEARRAFIWIGIAALVILTVFMARSLLIVFGGLVIAAMIDGGVRLLGRVLPIRRGWRIAIVLVLSGVFLAAVITYAGTTVAREAALLPAIIEQQLDEWAVWAQAKGFAVDASSIQSFAGQFASGVGTVTRALTGILGGITSLVLMGFLGIYIAAEPRLYERGVAWMLPEHRREEFYVTVSLMARKLRHLLAGRLFGMVVEGIFTWLMLTFSWVFIGGDSVPMAALLGLITGLLAFIPNIGALLSGILMVLVGFSGGTEMGLYTIFVYFFVQTLDGNVLIPLIAKKTVDLAPALVLSTQLILGVTFGIIGLALADPLVAMIKVALERRAERYDKPSAKQTIGRKQKTT